MLCCSARLWSLLLAFWLVAHHLHRFRPRSPMCDLLLWVGASSADGLVAAQLGTQERLYSLHVDSDATSVSALPHLPGVNELPHNSELRPHSTDLCPSSTWHLRPHRRLQRPRLHYASPAPVKLIPQASRANHRGRPEDATAVFGHKSLRRNGHQH